MKGWRMTVGVLMAALAVGTGRQALGQFTAAEVAERPKWEEFLKTAEIVKWEDIGEGVTKPVRLYLKKGDLEASAVWKNPNAIQMGVPDSWTYEIAAYRIDKLIGLDMVSPTVEREFHGKKGSLQLWVTSKYSLLKIMEEGIPIPEEARESTNRMKYVVRVFDCLIGNDDRTQQNLLYTQDWRTIVIDHSRSFRSTKEYVQRLVYGRNGIKSAEGRPLLFRRVPRRLVDSLRALDGNKIRLAVGPYLTDQEIEAVMARQKLLLEEIALMVKEQGEDKVLY
ncbi:MAG TPA: hypothetical protein VGB72_08575 [Acidobacteriota bacterium]